MESLGQVSSSERKGSQFETRIHQRFVVYMGLVHMKSDIQSQKKCLCCLCDVVNGEFNHSPRCLKLLRKYSWNVMEQKGAMGRKEEDSEQKNDVGRREEKVLVSGREAIAKSSNQIPPLMHFVDNHNEGDYSH
ncbi:hypothetical protein AVEN_27230-1 [Araneus ventricosus]|uniref:Uncharacterized protein n=1 Tax=Araneus ventricosus TaxID=182803 RepID=A0A4Y2CAB4_ARAVE|nr:hypothetical protein AVEN_27230-1 [Araneus ventricosus]